MPSSLTEQRRGRHLTVQLALVSDAAHLHLETDGYLRELVAAPVGGLREQLAEHLLDAFKLNADGDVAERFYSIATSPFVSVRVEPEASS